MLEDIFGVRCGEDLQDVECISKGGGIRIKAEMTLAAGLIAAVAPALPKEDCGDTGSEEPETGCGERVDHKRPPSLRGERCAQRQGGPSRARLGADGFLVGVLGGMRGWRELQA